MSHLASGGMAELYIARQEAVGGFEKELVLKMLQERYATNPRVLQMFLDEARLAAKLNHQNIVHMYDVDKVGGIHYIAMEYIHGETVTDIVRKSIADGGFLPLEHAVQIVADTAAGLEYAHEARDSDGRPARIVHRDVSPSNILVTYEGITKIVDFGIAKVQDQIREESGMRPGKVSYMSPEQVKGEVADHRADIYSLGIILYEITVGRRLWRGPPEEVLRRIVEEQVPPPTYVRRGYPHALELIIMKALEKRPQHRQQSAAELQHELLEFMEEAGLKSGPRRLARYMKDLFGVDASARPATNGVSGTPAAVEPEESEEQEELDFDRRAPLMMRVEPRSDDDADWDSGPAAANGGRAQAGAPAPRPPRQPSGAIAVAEAARPPGPPVAAAPAPASVPSALPPPQVGVPDVKTGGGSAMRWIVLAVFLAVGVVAFLATR
jgi:serine/threonine protein kinase